MEYGLINTNTGLTIEGTSSVKEAIAQYKRLDDEIKRFKAELLNVMKEAGYKSIEADGVKITLVDSTTKESFNTKKFREENPDLYDEYIEMKESAAYVKVDVKY